MRRKISSLTVSLVFVLSMFVVIDLEFDLLENAAGKTIYVDDIDGEMCWSLITTAVHMAEPGDTIYVYSGYYYEPDLSVDKTVNLIGEDMNTTTINGATTESDIVYITADWVNMSGFTIVNEVHPMDPINAAAVKIVSTMSVFQTLNSSVIPNTA